MAHFTEPEVSTCSVRMSLLTTNRWGRYLFENITVIFLLDTFANCSQLANVSSKKLTNVTLYVEACVRYMVY